ncbi:MAG: hypothetical protein RL483_1102 [Pseudomonadota bacterium]|jgi:quercetin dioxygenase-like cupin family protein
MTESDFLAQTADFDEVVTRDWPAHHVIPDHSHPFALRALVTAGQMWLTVDGQEQELAPGDVFELRHSQPHAERYGPAGASYLVARRHAA